MHADVYVIHNYAPRSLREIEEIIERIDVPALRDTGISIHQIGPTQHGYVRVAVERDAPVAQLKLDEMFGPNVIRVVEEPMARLLSRRSGVIPEHWPRRWHSLLAARSTRRP